MKYSDEQIFELAELVKRKTILAMRLTNSNEGNIVSISPHKIIFFFLDKLLKRSFYGNIHIRILGTLIQNPKETDITHKLEKAYEDINTLKKFLTEQEKDYDFNQTQC